MTKIRKIPAVMFSQHPDNACKPYWHSQPCVETHHEIREAYLMFREMGAQEMMWDWEGKFVDESVVERFLGSYPEFFQKKSLGRDLFLTFRIPNPRVESGYRLGRAFMAILAAGHAAQVAGFHTPPLFEVILPMTEKAAEIASVQESFVRIAEAASRSFGPTGMSEAGIEVIPIFESIDAILKSGETLKEYLEMTRIKPVYLRPFCARSDPALNSGIVPTTLAIKWALSEYAKLSEATGVAMYPIIAPGALPFRGGLTPQTTRQFLAEFPGVKTIVIQSAFRYDYPQGKVKNAIKVISETVADAQPAIVGEEKLRDIKTIRPWFEAPYQRAVVQMAPLVEKMAAQVPKRRERVQHIGLFGYARQMGKTRLPRAIGFTASCYSLGIPPEILGTGRGLKKARKEGKLGVIEQLYTELRPALSRSGRYLRRESVRELGLREVAEEIKMVEEYLGEKLGPKTAAEEQHQQLSSKIVRAMLEGKGAAPEVEQAAVLRRSVG